MRAQRKRKRRKLAVLCPIQDLMDESDSHELDAKAIAFLQVHNMAEKPGYQTVAERIMKSSGLEEESPETLVALQAEAYQKLQWDQNQRLERTANGRQHGGRE